MGMLDGLVNVVTGGLGDQIVGAVEKYFPPDMTPEQKANIALAAQNLELQRSAQATSAATQAEKDLDDRIAMYEGTASDLKSVPYLGALMLLLRGAQRPIWGYATIWMDYNVYSGVWKLDSTVLQNSLWVINILVLGFLFGERAVTNIMPFVTEFMKTSRINPPTK